MVWHFGWTKQWKIEEGSIKFPVCPWVLYKNGKLSEAALSANSWGLNQMEAFKMLRIKMKEVSNKGK